MSYSLSYMNIPIYKETAEYASAHNELEAYRASFKANMACKTAIADAISSNYSDNRLSSEKALESLREDFGIDRIAFILAVTVRGKDWDERFSDANKSWAKTVDVPADEDGWGKNRNHSFVIDSVHPGLVDLFVSRVRRELAETRTDPPQKESVLAKIQKPIPSSDSGSVSREEVL